MFWLVSIAALAAFTAIAGLVIAGMSFFASIPFAVGFVGALIIGALSTVLAIGAAAS